MSETSPECPEGSDYEGPPPRHFRDPGNGWVSPVEKLLLGIGLLVLTGVVLFTSWASYTMNQTKAEVQAAQRQTAENRAVTCQLLVALGQELPKSCFEPEVVSNYDPYAVAAPTRTAGLVCEIALKVGIREKDLPTVCAEVDGNG